MRAPAVHDGREAAPGLGRSAYLARESAALGSLTGYCPQPGKNAAVAIVPNLRPEAEAAPDPDRAEALMSGYELRSKLRAHAAHPRIAICGTRVFGDPLIITRELGNGTRVAHWKGVVLCNRAGCPVCAEVKARRFGDQVRRMLGGGGIWQHLIGTLSHGPTDPWELVYDRLLEGLRELTKGTAGKVTFEVVKATVRATETTWSWGAGWHVHFHILWNVSRPLLDAEKDLLKAFWCARTGAHADHGLRFGACFDCTDPGQQGGAAKYVSKLGHEISGGHKHPLPGHFKLGEIYERAAKGEGRFVALVREYQEATHGRRIYQLDKRAKKLRDAAPQLPDLVVVQEWQTTVDRLEFSGLSRIERYGGDPLAIYWPLEAAMWTRGDPAAAIGEQVTELLQTLDRGIGSAALGCPGQGRTGVQFVVS